MSVALNYVPVLLTHPGRTRPVSLDEYCAEDGYAGWRKALTTMTPEQVIEEVKASGLRGRGGAGFPAGMKWKSNITDRGVRQIKEKGGKVVIVPEKYSTVDLEDARKQCAVLTPQTTNTAPQ